ncbi:hypothetical protein [Maricaulis maris]|uniref:Uncharacterized protein n=1 Tax=Maricaulis maris TaxID=74318 RepID=A0A495DDC1_9PROT|nr:hypothetical protein [Maricaulis maris]RKR00318.1 hypothetical protein C7435_1523 [Maricaulis maris]
MRILVLLASLVATLAVAASAEANCRWQVATRLVGSQPGVGNIAGQTWPLDGIQTRVQARTPGGFWNTANWPATTADSDGFVRITSAIAFADPDCQTAREFRVQVRSYDTGMSWRTVHQQSRSGHSDHVGLFNPAPVHAVTLGNLVLSGEFRGDGVIFIENIGDPPLFWSNDDADENGGPVAQPADPGLTHGDADDDGTAPDITGATLEADPCHVYRLPIDLDIEFRFGQMPATPGPLSSDMAMRIETRTNGGGDMTRNRLTHHIRVENAGSRDFNAIHHCPVEVHVRVNEGPDARGGDGWSPPWTARIPDLAANAIAEIAVDTNLLGAGDDFAGEWGQDYEFVRVEVVLDATNRIAESAEGDNRIAHCYHAPTNTFAAMSQCEGDLP